MNQKISHFPNLTNTLPQEVKKIFEIFLKDGDEIRLVGGCVRDLLIKKPLKDFDFATKFLPEKTTEILQKNHIQAIPTGFKFGTITAVVNHKNFEITTLRKDSETDGRHCEPEFVDDYFLDAARRDFTINALYLDNKGSIYDFFEGIADLKNQKVKFIGDAQERIREDYLRILRFFRFSCDYAESLDSTSFAACAKERKNVKNLSRERVRMEFLKLLSSEKKENLLEILKAIIEEKISDELFSENLNLKALWQLFEFEKTFNFKANLNLKIAALFFNEDLNLKIFSREICATNLEKRYFNFLINNFSVKSQKLDLADLKQLLAFEEKELILDFYLINLLQNFNQDETSEAKNNIEFLRNFNLPKFPLNGEDAKSLGMLGIEVGTALKKAKEFWAANNFSLNKNDLIKFLRSLKNI